MDASLDFDQYILWDLNMLVTIALLTHSMYFLFWCIYVLFYKSEKSLPIVSGWTYKIWSIENSIMSITRPIGMIVWIAIVWILRSPEIILIGVLLIGLWVVLVNAVLSIPSLLLYIYYGLLLIIFCGTKIFLYFYIVVQIRKEIEQKIIRHFSVAITLIIIAIAIMYAVSIVALNDFIFFDRNTFHIFSHVLADSLSNDFYYSLVLSSILAVCLFLYGVKLYLLNKQINK